MYIRTLTHDCLCCGCSEKVAFQKLFYPYYKIHINIFWGFGFDLTLIKTISFNNHTRVYTCAFFTEFGTVVSSSAHNIFFIPDSYFPLIRSLRSPLLKY